MKKRLIVAGIIFLFFVSALAPMSLGYNIKIQNEEPINENSRFYTSYPLVNDNNYHLDVKYIKKPIEEIIVEDIYFTNPLNNDVLRAGDTIEIVGTITGNKFKNYKVEYGIGINPSNWQTQGITLINDGNSPIINDTVAIWNTSHISEKDFYSLRITTNYNKSRAKSLFNVNILKILFPRIYQLINKPSKYDVRLFPKDSQEINYIHNIYLDPSLKKGWPQRLYESYDSHGYSLWAGPSVPVAADIDDDDELELIVYFYSLPPKIIAFNTDGTIVEGFPVEIDASIEYSGAYYSPSIYDVDNDDSLEIVVSGREGIYIYNNDGTLQNKISIEISNPVSAEILLYDLNNDGEIEIIRRDTPRDMDVVGQYVMVFDINGNILPGWPQLFYNYTSPDGMGYFSCTAMWFDSAPAVGNFDDDSDMEIVIGGGRNVFDDPENCQETWHPEGRVTVYNMDGSILQGFPKDLNGFLDDSPSVGDINNDGFDEIVIGTTFFGWEYSYFDYGLFAIDRYGDFCQGWPRMINKRVASSAALADVNDNGFLDIIVSFKDDSPTTYIFDYLGNVLSGWPQSMSWHGYHSPVVGDVDGDGILDIVQTAGNGVYPDNYYDGGVYAWNFDGTLIEGFPKVTEIDAQGAATIADIDNDGSVELIASSCWDEDFQNYKSKHRSSIYVWELNNDYYEETMEWPMFHHDPQHTGYYALDFPILIKNYLK